ncbi:MAG: MBL fold metallo-hydrolase [Gemmataceae bacterium]|nr:MBL fold metallo-hydrolase [Gemmataceae bacterium]
MHRLAFLALLALAAPSSAEGKKRGLDIRWIDTDGGAATLIVTPAGESVLIDCGNPGKRDAERIAKTAKEAGLERIDHLVITHWHSDHYGGAEPLSRLIPIKNFHDRGQPEKLADDKNYPVLLAAYRKASKGRSSTLKAGDEIALAQAEGAPAVKLLCVCGSGERIAAPKGTKESPFAKEHKPQKDDPSDNAKSLGFVLSFGGFRFLDLGDLTWNAEHKLVSPADLLGKVDVYQVTHHGLEISNNPVLIKTVEPRVAVFNNGPRKGGHSSVTATLRRIPGIEGIYQMHRNMAKGAENAEPSRIANDGRKKEEGRGIVLRVDADARGYEVVVAGGKPFRHKTRSAK